MKHLILTLSVIFLGHSIFAQVDRTKAPKAQPNPEIKIEIPQPMVLANGLKVIAVENHKLPKVSFQLFVDYPYEMEGEKTGISGVFGTMLESGTKNTPKDKFDEEIDYIGASFYPNSRGFYASSLKKHTPQLLSLLNEVMTQPAFAQDDFDRIMAQNISELATLPSDAGSISNNVTNVVNYGKNHPYGEITTETTLSNITLDDVKNFYKKNFIPNNAYLVIVGDITQDDVKSYVNKYFENWKKGEEQKINTYTTPQAKGNNVYFVNKPGAVQSVINITHNVKLTPGHEDELKLKVLNQVLGGGSFSARLMSNLREDKAYTYGCYSSISSDLLMGDFSAGGSFRNEVTDSAVVQILDEIKRIGKTEVTDTELELVKKSMTGSFARALESSQTIAKFALNTIRYNLPTDYYANYLLKLEQVTKEELLIVAKKYLTPNNLNIVIVGNEEIADKLNVFDVDQKIDFKDFYGENQEQLKAVKEGVTSTTVLDNYILKMMMVNSKEELNNKLKKVKQIEFVAKSEIKEMNATILSHRTYGTPNKTAALAMIKTSMGTNVAQKEWFNGEAGGSVSAEGIVMYEGEELKDKMDASFPVPQMHYVTNKSILIDLMGISILEDVACYKLKVVNKEDISFEFYSVETGLLIQEESYSKDDEGNETSTTIKHRNHKEMGGVFIPTETEIIAQGQPLVFKTVLVKTNKKAKSKAYNGDFKKIEKLLGSM